ncbi:hypothetical protein N0V95_004101 [Ascochyta clinopodiicola]|nr:hypothetical protein N0V95_004101 [Ascochyta clinopodiicola]
MSLQYMKKHGKSPRGSSLMLLDVASVCAYIAKFISGTTETTTKKGYSLLRGEDYLDVEADHIQYRDSEDFLGEGTDRAKHDDQAEQGEQSAQPSSSKSKDVAEA